MADETTTPTIAPVAVTSTESGTSAPAPQPGGTLTTAPISAGTDTKSAFEAMIPEEYKTKQWMQDTLKSENPVTSLLSQFENAQKLTGVQKPGDNATPEQIKQWYNYLGVPENTEPYKYEAVWADADKDVGKVIDENRSPEIMEGIKAAAREAGITPKQFAALAAAQDKLLVEHNRAAIQKNLSDFEAVADQMFGANKKTVMDVGREMFRKHVPDALKDRIVNLPPEHEALFAAALHEIHKAYVKPDTFNPTTTTTASAGMSPGEKQLEISKMMKDPVLFNKQHRDHLTVLNRWRELQNLPPLTQPQ